jgi:hypothetical protein
MATIMDLAGGAPPPLRGLSADTSITRTVYTLIKNRQLSDVVSLLSAEVAAGPPGAAGSRAALSLLGFAHYERGEYVEAAAAYERLAGAAGAGSREARKWVLRSV